MGKHGEGWVIIQLAILILILGMQRIVSIEFPLWQRLLGGLIVVAAGAIIAISIWALGRNLAPFPKPVPWGRLVTDGSPGRKFL